MEETMITAPPPGLSHTGNNQFAEAMHAADIGMHDLIEGLIRNLLRGAEKGI
jgi:hypothetical protein